MRERFKGTGSLNTSNNNEIKEMVKSGSLSEEKRNVLDMWHTEDIDDSDKETLYEKYNISKDIGVVICDLRTCSSVVISGKELHNI